ncbi:hypothetical protein BC939DRAFT_490561 [Gamsiella multidivaricata]|uniref:uncharacterized protein n=1 Tax=Gamsiella multidivaricata TaxID=101098 RepID=UPI0022210A6D|nr:uncharacterized protein BC939DRAFT_490561 [Gamsiella multidivaricata]KAI7828951.1 hypothetical protein BC939DRAFT_490561 [Gamsiella multidivaricata]
MTVDDSVVQKLWKLTNELTAQLVFNRNATLELKQQLADLQAKTAQSSYPISVVHNVALHATQEHTDISLRIANERLMEENSQLQEQLREYERWMEYIMAKFRLQNELAVRLQEENTTLQARLADVGAVARRAISEEYYNTESIIEMLEIENQGLREMLGVASDNFAPMAVRHPGNRVSFPSTGSYVPSSGSDREQQLGTNVIAPPSPSEQTVKESALSTSPSLASVATPSPTPRPSKPTAQDTSPSIAISSAMSTASNSTVTSPRTRKSSTDSESVDIKDMTRKPAATRKKSDETSPGAVGTKGGMTINTHVVPKRTSSITNNNNTTSHAGGGSTGQKAKKSNRNPRS